MNTLNPSSPSLPVQKTIVGECPVCASTSLRHYATVRDVEYFTSDEQFDYLKCDGCGAVSLSDPPLDRLSEIYPPNYYSFQQTARSLGTRVKDALDRRLFRRCLAKLPNRPLAVLDVGGGAGHQLSLIRGLDERVQKTVVVDLDKTAESLAKSAGHEFFHGRIEDYRPDVQFDLIIALNLIEHVAKPLEVLEKLQNCLSDTGMLIIKTPNIDSLDHRLFRDSNWGGFHCPRHWVLFDRESFLGLASRAGLRATTFAFTQGAPFWAVSVLAALHRKKLIRLSAARPAYQHPLYGILTLFFAGIDFLRRPFARTSQMFVILTRAAD
jgi:2-polyprenyl-3-methyl-5-hydroxy-6-metoxy-1,4-benzoquinol methylase